MFLDEEEIFRHLLDYQSDKLSKITFNIPSIHCSSCIWLLENISRFDSGIVHSKINFSKKKLHVDFNPSQTSLRKIAELLYQLSYEPEISLEQNQTNSTVRQRGRYLKIGLAGFCFGNIMLLAFPDYLGIELDSEFTSYFTYISLALSLPVLFYCSSEFFLSAIGGLRKKVLNIDLPIAIGIIALFSRSLYEILSHTGSGYLDSMAALVFFLLIGRWVQEKTYEGLSFDRNFKSYFPLAVQRVSDGIKKNTLVSALEVNDLIEIRSEEIVPCDAILISKACHIDYSFVTGESDPHHITEGSKIYAGGKIVGGAASMRVIKKVSQSYLTQLWNHDSFNESSDRSTPSLIDQISNYFTPAVLAIALIAGGYWYVIDSSKVLFVISSVLIVACPCALALASPFTLNATMNQLGRHGMYLKGTHVLEKIWKIKKLIFDKTGTITTGSGQKIQWHGEPLKESEKEYIGLLASQSVHPLSQQLSNHFALQPTFKVTDFKEEKGKGIEGNISGHLIKLGAPGYVGLVEVHHKGAIVAVSIDQQIKGHFQINNSYRPGLTEMIDQLHSTYSFLLLSGDNDHERDNLEQMFPAETTMSFDQKPEDKLAVVEQLEKNEYTMMIGDGLNDAGALKASFVGISVAENRSSFTPASDVIMMGNQLTLLPKFLNLINKSRSVIYAGFIVSFLYNIIGLSLAVMGYITPVIAAILMPISSISVVLLSTLGIQWISKFINFRS